MTFDPCPEQKTQIILRAGRIIRKLKGLPDERNITVLYNETALLLGIPPQKMNSQMADHLPAPHEMKDEQGRSFIPRKDCPKCGKKDFLVLASICPSCKDSEGGKYHSGWKCIGKDCGFITDKSEMYFTQRLKAEGGEIPQSGSKESLGIKTITDDGLK